MSTQTRARVADLPKLDKGRAHRIDDFITDTVRIGEHTEIDRYAGDTGRSHFQVTVHAEHEDPDHHPLGISRVWTGDDSVAITVDTGRAIDGNKGSAVVWISKDEAHRLALALLAAVTD